MTLMRKPSLEMVDLVNQYRRLKTEIDNSVLEVMGRAAYINGPPVGLFANELASYLKIDHVVPCANGTDALQLALMALDLKPGDEVITTSFSFVATAEVIALLGLKPVFADVDVNTFNICPEHVQSLITNRTKVLLPVHLFGQAADMNALMKIARDNNLYIIEDVAQSLGATYNLEGQSKQLGTMGHIGCTSFFPSKNLGCFGDGGACFTGDKELAAKMKMIADHGSARRYYHDIVGVNSRLDTIQAAVLRVKLPLLDEFIKSRQQAAEFYNKGLANIPGLILPVVQEGALHSYNQYTVRVTGGKRDALIAFLEKEGIPARVYYPLALHQQLAFTPKPGDKAPKCDISEQLCNEVLSLPMHTELNEEALAHVVAGVKAFFRQ